MFKLEKISNLRLKKYQKKVVDLKERNANEFTQALSIIYRRYLHTRSKITIINIQSIINAFTYCKFVFLPKLKRKNERELKLFYRKHIKYIYLPFFIQIPKDLFVSIL